MNGLRERSHDDEPGPEQNPNGGIGDNLGNLRQRGEVLLSAADDAIERGLSRQSHRFVTNVRQASGQ